MRAFISDNVDLKQNYVFSESSTRAINNLRWRPINIIRQRNRALYLRTLKGFNDARSRLAANCKLSVSISRERVS